MNPWQKNLLKPVRIDTWGVFAFYLDYIIDVIKRYIDSDSNSSSDIYRDTVGSFVD